MAITYFDHDGAVIDDVAWSELRMDRTKRIIGSAIVTIDGVRVLVSTQWYGVQISPREGEPSTPFMFDTVLYSVRGENVHDGWNRRYGTRDEAVAGHKDVVEQLRDGRWPS